MWDCFGKIDMKILITGSSGFVGNHAVEAAKQYGWEVVTFDARSGFDINDFESVRAAAAGCDYVLHLAAYTSLADFAKNMYDNYTTNIVGFLNVIEAARLAKVKKFVYASSSAVYPGDVLRPQSETDVIDPQTMKGHYGKSKIINEMIAASYHLSCGLPCLGLRFFNIYGPGDETKVGKCAPMQHFYEAARKGKPMVVFGDGSQSKDFIYIDDAIPRIMTLVGHPSALGICNVGTGTITSFNELAQLFGNMFETKIQHVPHPAREFYQYFTWADTRRMVEWVGNYFFKPIGEGLRQLKPGPE